MKIKRWNDETIEFSDGSSIAYDHEQDCCEYNYADFSVLEIMYDGEEFDEYRIEFVEYGFNLVLFDEGTTWPKLRIYIPFYSSQNGYYSTDCDLIVKGKAELRMSGAHSKGLLLDDPFDPMTREDQGKLSEEYYLHSVVCEVCGVVKIAKDRDYLDKWIRSHLGTDPVTGLFVHPQYTSGVPEVEVVDMASDGRFSEYRIVRRTKPVGYDVATIAGTATENLMGEGKARKRFELSCGHSVILEGLGIEPARCPICGAYILKGRKACK